MLVLKKKQYIYLFLKILTKNKKEKYLQFNSKCISKYITKPFRLSLKSNLVLILILYLTLDKIETEHKICFVFLVTFKI